MISTIGNENRDYPSIMNIDPEKLQKSIEVHSSQLIGFTDLINKFTNFVFGYSRGEVKRVSENISKMGEQLDSQYKIIEENLKGFEETAKSNVKVAMMMKDFKEKDELKEIFTKMQQQTATPEEIHKALSAYTRAGAAGEEEIYGGLAYKKSTYLKEGVGYLKEEGRTKEEKESKAEDLINMLVETKSISKKRAEGLRGRIEEDGVTDNFIKILENLTVRIEKSTEKDILMIKGDLPKSVAAIRAGGMKGAGVGAAAVRSMATSMGGMGGLVAAIGPLLAPVLIGAGIVGLIASLPGLFTKGVEGVGSILDQAGEFILLLAIVLPFIWDWTKKNVFPEKKAPGEEKTKGQAVLNVGKSYYGIGSHLSEGEFTEAGKDVIGGIRSSTKLLSMLPANSGLGFAHLFMVGRLFDAVINPAETTKMTKQETERSRAFGALVEERISQKEQTSAQAFTITQPSQPVGSSLITEEIVTGQMADFHNPAAEAMKGR